jgi:hypothetical protein
MKYLWLDADAWIQRQDAVDAYVEGALRTGFAITPEIDPAYGDDEVLRAHYNSFDMFGDEHLKGFIANGAMNVGVIAGRPDAPHWRAWRRMIETNIQKTDVVSLLFLLDQTALCIVCLRSDLTTALLPATCNWISHFAHPMTSGDGAVLLRPSPSYEELGIIHQTYDTKRIFLPLRRLGGGVLSRTLAYQANSQLAPDEYVSAGLSVILADQCFPHMMRGDQSLSTWNYLRRGLPHAWLVDRRIPEWGFLNRDEAHILYNLALGFSKIRALQIGCFLGWSTCHLAMAGPAIDVIDPLLADPGVLANVQSSLRAGRVLSRVNLIPGRSPSAVHKLAEEHPDGYSLFFIDGDHEGDAPLNDVKACEPYAARDCAMLFHFLVSPHVTNAVLYLKERGWRIRVYHTAQIMAVAWRGNVSPIVHWPDPRIEWLIPTHVIPLLN